MFISHYGIGFGAKAAAPETSLGSLLLAALFLDLLWPTLLLLRVERVSIAPDATEVSPLNFVYYPFSHSLLLTVIWGIVFAGVYFALRRYKRGTVAMGLAVVSHWFLDFIVHQPDLPLYPAGKLVGLSLWSSKSGTILLEMAIFLIGLGLYFNKTIAMDEVDWRIGFLIILILGGYFWSMFGPPPSSVSNVIWTAQAQWLLVAWGYWVDWRRVSKYYL